MLPESIVPKAWSVHATTVWRDSVKVLAT